MFTLIWTLLLIVTLWIFFYLFWLIKFKNHHQDQIPVLAYHQVSDDFGWSITRQTVCQFERGIKFLHAEGYRSIALAETLNPNYESDAKKAVLTFDDGYEDFYLNAFPILLKYGFTACIFVVTGYIEGKSDWDYNWGRYKKKHLSWKQIDKISKAGFEIGSHTVNHPDLTTISKRFVNYELKVSKEILENKLGQAVDFLSYPFGRYNRYVQEETEKLGYKGAFVLSANLKEKGFNPFSIPRRGVYLLDSPLTLNIKLVQSKLFWIEEMKGWVINRFPGWTILLKGSPDYNNLKTTPETQH